MQETVAPTPTKDQPHPFQAGPEAPTIAADPNHASGDIDSASKCALCGAPPSALTHVEGRALADAESPNWG